MIEMVMAIVILASSLTILLGLQSSIISHTVDDHYRKQAMMYARYILAAIESRDSRSLSLPVETTRGTVSEIVSNLLETDTIVSGDPTIEKQLEVELAVTEWEIPNLEENALKRVEVTVRWGPTDQQRLLVTYFMPYREADATDEDEDPLE